MIVDSAIYVDGRRAAEPASLEETYEACRKQHGLAWIGLYEPPEEEFSSVAEEFGLHPLAVEDAIEAHQRPKIERYGEALFVVLKPAHYIDESETVEFGEIHVFAGRDFVLTVRHGEASALHGVRRRVESEPELLRKGPEAILYAIMDRVVDDYGPVVAGLENDIDEIETEVFGGNASVSQRIYQLSREVIEFQRAARPLAEILALLVEDKEIVADPELQSYLRDVQDHALRVQEQVEALTGASIQQNNEVKKISAWAAILFAPTLIGTVYGMNFDYMPELHWTFGYPFAMVLMVMVSVTLYLVFKRRGWL